MLIRFRELGDGDRAESSLESLARICNRCVLLLIKLAKLNSLVLFESSSSVRLIAFNFTILVRNWFRGSNTGVSKVVEVVCCFVGLILFDEDV